MAAAGVVYDTGTAKWKANMGGDGKSLAAGMMGADGTGCVDLTGSRVAYLQGDTFVATAAGQGRTSGCKLPRNVVTIQSGSYDPAAATFTTFTGPGATSLFPEDSLNSSPCWYWPVDGVMLDGVLIISTLRMETAPGSFGFATRGITFYLIPNPADDPSSWFPIQRHLPGGADVGIQTVQLFDGADGWMYLVGEDAARQVFLGRLDRAKAKLGQFEPIYWWMGTVRGFGLGRPRAFENRWPLTKIAPGDLFRVNLLFNKRSGDWLEIAAKQFPRVGMSYQLGASLQGPWPAPPANFFDPPENAMLDGQGRHIYGTYNVSSHSFLTWPGKVAGDVMLVYAIGSESPYSVFTDTTAYWPVFVKATGLT